MKATCAPKSLFRSILSVAPTSPATPMGRATSALWWLQLLQLAGLQQIEYVFAYPQQQDIAIAGFAESWRA